MVDIYSSQKVQQVKVWFFVVVVVVVVVVFGLQMDSDVKQRTMKCQMSDFGHGHLLRIALTFSSCLSLCLYIYKQGADCKTDG